MYRTSFSLVRHPYPSAHRLHPSLHRFSPPQIVVEANNTQLQSSTKERRRICSITLDSDVPRSSLQNQVNSEMTRRKVYATEQKLRDGEEDAVVRSIHRLASSGNPASAELVHVTALATRANYINSLPPDIPPTSSYLGKNYLVKLRDCCYEIASVFT